MCYVNTKTFVDNTLSPLDAISWYTGAAHSTDGAW